jgi:hypothetical protein
MKLKIGDRVKVYCHYPFKGKISGSHSMANGDKYFYVTEDGFFSAHNESPFHYKQCRKLINVTNKEFIYYQKLIQSRYLAECRRIGKEPMGLWQLIEEELKNL